MSVTVNGSTGLTFNDGTSQATSAFYGGLAMRNRIINGAMTIDQRNAGASVTPTNGQFSVDRFACNLSAASKYSAQQSSVAPAGFTNSLLITSLSSYSVGANDYFLIRQSIEGFNAADLGFGTASASPVTLSFWVRSSLTGTFGGALENSASNRCYPFSYTISSANTWEQKSVTIAGDTTGTWLTNNGIGIKVTFSLGMGSNLSGTAGAWVGSEKIAPTGATSVVGTNGATFYITGVQLEKGSTATSFDYRPYGTELALCQRYYEKSYNTDVAIGSNTYTGAICVYTQLNTAIVTGGGITTRYAVVKRATPTVTAYSKAGTAGKITEDNSGTEVNATVDLSGMAGFRVYASFSAQAACNLAAHYTSSAEL